MQNQSEFPCKITLYGSSHSLSVWNILIWTFFWFIVWLILCGLLCCACSLLFLYYFRAFIIVFECFEWEYSRMYQNFLVRYLTRMYPRRLRQNPEILDDSPRKFKWHHLPLRFLQKMLFVPGLRILLNSRNTLIYFLKMDSRILKW